MRAHPHLYLTCGLRTHPGHPCPPPFPQLTQPRRSAIVSCAPTPTIPRSDHNKDTVIRPGTLRFPYAQTAERAPISCLFLGDRRLGEGRTISLPRSTLTGAAAKPTATSCAACGPCASCSSPGPAGWLASAVAKSSASPSTRPPRPCTRDSVNTLLPELFSDWGCAPSRAFLLRVRVPPHPRRGDA